MSDGSTMVAAATLIGDYARAKMLTALMGGRALTATELADAAGITGARHCLRALERSEGSGAAQGARLLRPSCGRAWRARVRKPAAAAGIQLRG